MPCILPGNGLPHHAVHAAWKKRNPPFVMAFAVMIALLIIPPLLG
jgi:hypothetical protein